LKTAAVQLNFAFSPLLLFRVTIAQFFALKTEAPFQSQLTIATITTETLARITLAWAATCFAFVHGAVETLRTSINLLLLRTIDNTSNIISVPNPDFGYQLDSEDLYGAALPEDDS
jgi:hypothetical protein